MKNSKIENFYGFRKPSYRTVKSGINFSFFFTYSARERQKCQKMSVITPHYPIHFLFFYLYILCCSASVSVIWKYIIIVNILISALPKQYINAAPPHSKGRASVSACIIASQISSFSSPQQTIKV